MVIEVSMPLMAARRARTLAAALLAANMTVANPSSAEDATTLYDQGVNAARAGQWETARVLLLQSFERHPDVKTAANLGRVELVAGKPRDAAEHLSFFLRAAPGISDDDRRATDEMLAKAKSRIGALSIHVNVDHAEVLVDGRRVGSSPLDGPVFVEPGSRRIEARKEGFSATSRGIDVTAGATPVVELKLAPAPPVPPPPKQERPKAIPQVDAPWWRTWGIAGGAGLATAGIGLGIGFSIATQLEISAKTAAELGMAPTTAAGNPVCRNPRNEARCTAMDRTIEGYRNVAIGGFVVGGAAVAGVLSIALWGPTGPGSSMSRKASLSIAPAVRGVVVTGSF
jgi:PEGA domain